MITGSEEESRTLMMNAAISIVARFGFEGFTTKKWAAEAGVAEGSLYYHFRSKHDLLDEAFFMIDREIAGILAKDYTAQAEPGAVRELLVQLWLDYYHYLLANPEKTLYYYRYRTSPRFTQEVQEQEEILLDAFARIVEILEQVKSSRISISEQALWYFLVDVTTGIAFRIISKGTEHTEKTEKEMLNLLMDGIMSLVKRDMDP